MDQLGPLDGARWHLVVMYGLWVQFALKSGDGAGFRKLVLVQASVSVRGERK